MTSAAEWQRWREGRCLGSERAGSLAADLALARRKQAPCAREIPPPHSCDPAKPAAHERTVCYIHLLPGKQVSTLVYAQGSSGPCTPAWLYSGCPSVTQTCPLLQRCHGCWQTCVPAPAHVSSTGDAGGLQPTDRSRRPRPAAAAAAALQSLSLSQCKLSDPQRFSQPLAALTRLVLERPLCHCRDEWMLAVLKK